MTITVEPPRASRIRALAEALPFLSDHQLAAELRRKGMHVVASEVRHALGTKPLRRIKRVAS